MAEKEDLTERIKYLADLLKLSAVFLIAIGGGTMSLLLGDWIPFRIVLAASGLIGIVTLISFLLSLDRKIRSLIEDLKKV